MRGKAIASVLKAEDCDIARHSFSEYIPSVCLDSRSVLISGIFWVMLAILERIEMRS